MHEFHDNFRVSRRKCVSQGGRVRFADEVHLQKQSCLEKGDSRWNEREKMVKKTGGNTANKKNKKSKDPYTHLVSNGIAGQDPMSMKMGFFKKTGGFGGLSLTI